MADFCTHCAREMDLPRPDIDVQAIFESLELGTFMVVLCEGCGLEAIKKDLGGNLKVSYIQDDEDGDNEYRWVDYPQED